MTTNPQAAPSAVRILIVDDHPVVREGLAMQIATQPDLAVCGEAAEQPLINRLSDRELEAFELMGHGQTTESIAAKMHVSPKTVETYRARIKEKLHLNNITELIQRAVQWVLEKK